KLPAPATAFAFGLSIVEAELSSANLNELAKLDNLQALQLIGVNVADDAFKTIATFPNLRSLVLNYTKVTAAGLKNLKGAKSLNTLHLGKTGLTKAGLKELAALPNLRSLCLLRKSDTEDESDGTEVNDEWLKELPQLSGLQALHLGNSEVTDAGLKEL